MGAASGKPIVETVSKALPFALFLPPPLPSFSLSFFYIIIIIIICLSRAAPAAYGGSQAQGLTRAVAAGLTHSHSNSGSEPSL